MANLRRSLIPQPGIDAPKRRRRWSSGWQSLWPPRRQSRWPLVAGALALGLLALAWINGGETPLRPIAEPVQLPEQPQ